MSAKKKKKRIGEMTIFELEEAKRVAVMEQAGIIEEENRLEEVYDEKIQEIADIENEIEKWSRHEAPMPPKTNSTEKMSLSAIREEIDSEYRDMTPEKIKSIVVDNHVDRAIPQVEKNRLLRYVELTTGMVLLTRKVSNKSRK